MLETKSVINTYKELEQELLKNDSAFMRFTKEHSLRGAELAQMYQAMQRISIEAAISIERGREELNLKNREVALLEEKTRQELELSSLNANAQLKTQQAETLKSLIQGEAMQRSIGDNAAINKSNAYVGFLNVAGNAEERAAITEHSRNVIATINEINSRATTTFNPLLDKLRAELIGDVGENLNKEVFLHLPKVVLNKGESIKIMGMTSLEGAVKLVVGKKEFLDTKTIYYTGENAGEVKVSFSVQNGGKWISDSAILKVEE